MIRNLFIVFMLLGITLTHGQEKIITGTVSNESGGLPGVSVIVKGTTNGTETDFDGIYSIKASLGDILVFTFLGYKTVNKIIGTSLVINLKMIEDDTVLDEIIVTSLGLKREKYALGYAISGIKLKGSISIKSFTPKSGQLTAGEINDNEKWLEWKKLTDDQEFLSVKNDWQLNIDNRIEVKVVDNNNDPIVNAGITLSNKKGIKMHVRTDIFGKAVLFRDSEDAYTIQAVYKNQIQGLNVLKNHKLLNFVFLENEKLNDIDVMFTIDATGSMGDEISYLKSEIENIITRVDNSILKKRVGLTFYRDHGDKYLVREFDFTTNIPNIKENLSKQSAGGGGDYEEAVEEALKTSLSMSWSENAKARLLFLLLDAPPHLNQENVLVIKSQIKKAQKKGIKIIPIVASGANKTVEFLMRFFSVSTNGTYVFLTDDSGIGNPHLKPTSKDFKVEKLNDLIVRLIEKYSGV